jgi:hypothetical protein
MSSCESSQSNAASQHFRDHWALAGRATVGVSIRSDGEALFSRRCTSEDQARYVANKMKQDELNAGHETNLVGGDTDRSRLDAEER